MNREQGRVKGLAVGVAPLALCLLHLALPVPSAAGGAGGDVTLVFHPFLLDTDERFAVLLETLAR
jgi:hypothetical protein